jgi:hypothetical protein
LSLLVNKALLNLPFGRIGLLKEVKPSIITVLFKESSDFPPKEIGTYLYGLVLVGCLLWCSVGGLIEIKDDSSIDFLFPLPLVLPSVEY